MKQSQNNCAVAHQDKLNSAWILWHHDINNPHYHLEDYKKLLRIETVQDFWIAFNQIKDVSSGMYFLMRDGVPPIWEHPVNKNGGAWKFRIRKSEAHRVWINLALTVIGETISDKSDKITGISISPKFQNTTVRVWNSDNVRHHKFSNDIDPHIIFKKSIYESNQN